MANQGYSDRTRIPLENFFRNPDKTSYQISPDGRFLAYLAPWQSRLNLFTHEFTQKRVQRITHETERNLAGYFWGNSNRLVYLKDHAGDENFHLYAVSVDGKDTIDLTPYAGITVQVIDQLRDNDDEMIIGMNLRNREIFDAYRINISSGTLILEAENPGNITEWKTDHSGKIRIAITTDGVNQSILHRADHNKPFETLITTNFRETLHPLLFTFDNLALYALSNIGRDKMAIVLFDLSLGMETKVLYEHDKVDLEGLNFSHNRKVLTHYYYTDWKMTMVHLDPVTALHFSLVEKQVGEDQVMLVSQSRDEKIHLFRTYSDRSLGEYYLLNSENAQLDLLAEVSPWLDKNALSTMHPVSYTSRDGLIIHGYLTLPGHAGSGKLPVVINPHGGPWVRDTWGFNPEVQYLAHNGYAVFQLNYRGSTGYGRKFWESSFKQWGKKMQDDITDGVNWLIEAGIADPARIAIYGGSYGGYAALAGLTFTPDLYACGIDYVGVSNLFTFMETIPPYWKPYLEMMYEMVGHPDTDHDLLHSASPVFHASRIKAPLLVAQGKNDPRVNINESNQIVDALRNKGVDVEYLVKDNEGHGFHNEENRFEFYRAMERFLRQHLHQSEEYV